MSGSVFSQTLTTEQEMLIEEVESVLDNDYYSDNCHPREVLEELREKLNNTKMKHN